MSRIKIILPILIIVALGIVFVQNREPIALKLLCADFTQSCLYRTPQLPLAAWIALSTFFGAIANWSIQVLNRYGYRNSHRQKPLLDDDLYPSQTNAVRKSRRDKFAVSTDDPEDLGVKNRFTDATNYEAKQEPQNIERSGSTYSYKYREAGDRIPNEQDNEKKIIEPDMIANQNRDKDDEEWI